MSKQPRPLFQVLEHFSLIFPMSLLCSVYSGSLRGRLHRFAMETCSACIDPHTVFALVPRANRLKNALAADAFCCLSARGCWRAQPTLRAPFTLNRRFFRSFI